MYTRNAELLHLPKILITESSIPTLATVVAVPIRKLCLAKFCSAKLTAQRASQILLVNVDFVRVHSSWNWKKGFLWGYLLPCIVWQLPLDIGNNQSSQWKCLHLFSVLSMATSPHARYFVLPKVLLFTQIERSRRSRDKAAHTITMSWFVRWGNQCSFNLRKIVGVIDRCTLVDTWEAWTLWMPDWTNWRQGIEENS